MTTPLDRAPDGAQRLRAAIAVRERMTPDVADVLAGVEVVVRRRRRNRRAGVAALATGATAAFLIAAWDPSGSRTRQVRIPPAQPSTTAPGPVDSTAPAPPVGPTEPVDATAGPARARFYLDGYTRYDAVALAKEWGLDDDFAAATEAGRRLQAGQVLPVEAGSSPYDPDWMYLEPFHDPVADQAQTAFSAEGYTTADALALSSAWDVMSLDGVKFVAGVKVLAGEDLPVDPGETPTEDGGTRITGAAEDFAAAGYTWADSVALMKVWGFDTIDAVRSVAGLEVRSGDQLPVRPGTSTPDPQFPEPAPGAE